LNPEIICDEKKCSLNCISTEELIEVLKEMKTSYRLIGDDMLSVNM